MIRSTSPVSTLFAGACAVAFAVLGAGCKVQSYKGQQIRSHESLFQQICADKGGYVQVNIDGCTVPGFPFYGEFIVENVGGYHEVKTLRDGQNTKFARKLNAGECGAVNIVNMDDGAAVSCNFHVYWDL